MERRKAISGPSYVSLEEKTEQRKKEAEARAEARRPKEFVNKRLLAVSDGFHMAPKTIRRPNQETKGRAAGAGESALEKIGMFTAVSGKPLTKLNSELLADQELFDKEVMCKVFQEVQIDYGKEKLKIGRDRQFYLPILKHPLPLSAGRIDHEYVLRRVLACKPDKQAVAAVTLKDPWALEEVYMRGAPVDVPNHNGFTPLHLASSMNLFEIMMVLFHIGVDVNCETMEGLTPLYLAVASKSTQAAILLREEGALMEKSSYKAAPAGRNILDIRIPALENGSVVNLVAKEIGMAKDSLNY